MARRIRRGFSWIRRQYNTNYAILLNGVDVRQHVLSCEFSKAIAPEIGTFIVRLDNNNGEYSTRYKGGEEFEVRYDFGSSASTTRYKGFVEELKESFGGAGGHVLEVRGSHVSGVLSDKTVIKSFTGASADSIIKDLFSTYFSSFTVANVEVSADSPTVSWNNFPFWSAVSEIAKSVGFVLRVDDDKDVHFFKSGTKTNTQEAIVYNDTLIFIEGLGSDTVEVRNKIRVYGAGNEGLPVLYTASDSLSQGELKLSYSDGIKERVIDSGDVNNVADATSIGDRELAAKKDKKDHGRVTSWMLASLEPGENIWITDPVQHILGQFLVAKVTHFLPAEQSICDIQDVKSISNLFRDRDLKSVSLEKITNPFDLDFSFNFEFDDDLLTDETASDSNITTSSGQLILSSGSLGSFRSVNKTTVDTVTQFEVKAVGENLQNADFFVSADGTNFQQVLRDELVTVTDQGKLLRLQIDLKASTVRVNSAVILYS